MTRGGHKGVVMDFTIFMTGCHEGWNAALKNRRVGCGHERKMIDYRQE
jgi:hypothetical protein